MSQSQLAKCPEVDGQAYFVGCRYKGEVRHRQVTQGKESQSRLILHEAQHFSRKVIKGARTITLRSIMKWIDELENVVVSPACQIQAQRLRCSVFTVRQSRRAWKPLLTLATSMKIRGYDGTVIGLEGCYLPCSCITDHRLQERGFPRCPQC